MSKKQGEFKMLSDESLTKRPELVFEIGDKLGEGSYGSVFKGIHRETGEVMAIKQVPVDTDLQEIMREITIMQDSSSEYVVKFYGSYFNNSDLWIVMEYCGAGSVADIIKFRKKPLTEDEIAPVLLDTLKGLDHLHSNNKLHRDIKAGNILLNFEGHAKLADFGVAGQITDTMTKRRTLIGTPAWMAPEVIEEKQGYSYVADIWSLGITALEMAEGKPPFSDIHPVRAMFKIPNSPSPTLKEPEKWSPQFRDFISRCLIKNPDARPSAKELLNHPFIKNAKPRSVLNQMITEAMENREKRKTNHLQNSEENQRNIAALESKILSERGQAVAPCGAVDSLSEELNNTMVINNYIDDENTIKEHNVNSVNQADEHHLSLLEHINENRTYNERLDRWFQPVARKQEILPYPLVQPSVTEGAVDDTTSIFSEPPDPFSTLCAKKFTPMVLDTQTDQQELQRFSNEMKGKSLQQLQSVRDALGTNLNIELEHLRTWFEMKQAPILEAIERKMKQRPVIYN